MLSEQAASLIALNQAMQKVTSQMNRLALSTNHLAVSLGSLGAFDHQIVSMHFLMESLFPRIHAAREVVNSSGGGGGAGALPTIQNTFKPNIAVGPIRAAGLGEKAFSYSDRKIDPLLAHSPEFAAGHFVNRLLKENLPVHDVARVNAHLRGGSQLTEDQQRDYLHDLALRTKTSGGRQVPVFSRQFINQLANAMGMATNQHWRWFGYSFLKGKNAQASAREAARDKAMAAPHLGGPVGRGGGGAGSEFFGEGMQTALRYGAGTLAGALQSASPDAFATLASSVKLAAASLGRGLVPAAMKASAFFQGISRKVEQMDPETRDKLGMGAVGALGVGVSLYALKAATETLKSLWSTMRGGFSGAGSLFTSGGGLLGMGAAAAAGGGYSVFSHFREMDALREKSQKDTIREMARSPDQLREEFRNDPAYQHLREYEPESQQQELNRLLLEEQQRGIGHKNAAEYLKGNKTLDGQDRSSFLGAIFGLSNVLTDAIRPGEGTIVQHERLAVESHARQSRLQQMGAMLRGDVSETPEMKENRERMARLSNAKETGQANDLLLDLQSRVQPAYFSVEDMYRKVQLEALSENPLQEEIRKIQLDMLDQLTKSNKHLESLLGQDAVARFR